MSRRLSPPYHPPHPQALETRASCLAADVEDDAEYLAHEDDALVDELLWDPEIQRAIAPSPPQVVVEVAAAASTRTTCGGGLHDACRGTAARPAAAAMSAARAERVAQPGDGRPLSPRALLSQTTGLALPNEPRAS